MPAYITLKLSKYLENWTKNMIPTDTVTDFLKLVRTGTSQSSNTDIFLTIAENVTMCWKHVVGSIL